MSTSITRTGYPDYSLVPVALLADQVVRSVPRVVLHDVIGRAFPEVTFVGSGDVLTDPPRAGSLVLLFGSASHADNARYFLSQPGTYELMTDEAAWQGPGAMGFAVVDAIVCTQRTAHGGLTGAGMWTVEVPFREVERVNTAL